MWIKVDYILNSTVTLQKYVSISFLDRDWSIIFPLTLLSSSISSSSSSSSILLLHPLLHFLHPLENIFSSAKKGGNRDGGKCSDIIWEEDNSLSTKLPRQSKYETMCDFWEATIYVSLLLLLILFCFSLQALLVVYENNIKILNWRKKLYRWFMAFG